MLHRAPRQRTPFALAQAKDLLADMPAPPGRWMAAWAPLRVGA
jgi:hypothetical protein